jgi:type VI secretion system secreted protein Hcp
MSFGQANRPAASTGPIEVFLVFEPDPSKQALPKGESQVALPSGPKGEPTTIDGAIEVGSFDFGMENSPNIGSASAGAGAGKAKFHDFTIKKAVDAASPLLFEAAATGGHYNIVRLVLRRSGGKLPYLVFTFKLVGVKSVDWSGRSGGDRPEEQVVFEYGSVAITYRKQNLVDGSLGQPTFQSWSRISNSPDTSLTPEIKP